MNKKEGNVPDSISSVHSPDKMNEAHPQQQTEESRRAERLSRELARIQEIAHIGTWYLDCATNHVTWTEELYRMYGFDPSLPVPPYTEHMKLFTPKSWALLSSSLAHTQENGIPYELELETIKADGSNGWMWVRGEAVLGSGNEIVGVWGAAQDITEHKKTTLALQESEQKLQNLFLNLNSGIVVHGADTQILLANDQASELLGLSIEQMKGKAAIDPAWCFVHEDETPYKVEAYPVARVLATRQPVRNMVVGINRPNTNDRVWVLVNGFPEFDDDGQLTQAVVTFIDITELKKAEALLQRSQKLESLGVLAGGIAHDFNNLLGGIYGYVDMARDDSTEANVKNYLIKSLNTIDRARALTQQLLTFAKGGAPSRKTSDLFPFVQETAAFALSGSNVSCRVNVETGLWKCDFDKNQMGQVIDNIVINAQQAMPMGGTIDVSAVNVSFREGEHPTLSAGPYVKISIVDQGIGIPNELLPQIFDPFFTTKQKGHGLGLATCYSILKRHDGAIEVESILGKGTSFHILIPATWNAAIWGQAANDGTHVGKGTFIVMDDEDVMRETIGAMLQSFGYHSLLTSTGEEAIHMFVEETKASRTITGMIFDLTIPGAMGGDEAVVKIREMDALVPVFVASGYAQDPIVSNPSKYGFTASICKPFRKKELAELLEKHL